MNTVLFSCWLDKGLNMRFKVAVKLEVIHAINVPQAYQFGYPIILESSYEVRTENIDNQELRDLIY